MALVVLGWRRRWRRVPYVVALLNGKRRWLRRHVVLWWWRVHVVETSCEVERCAWKVMWSWRRRGRLGEEVLLLPLLGYGRDESIVWRTRTDGRWRIVVAARCSEDLRWGV